MKKPTGKPLFPGYWVVQIFTTKARGQALAIVRRRKKEGVKKAKGEKARPFGSAPPSREKGQPVVLLAVP
ncbi:MAG: hypothetical protein JW959_10740 [Pirellulales bacterium]|nr:hypothetical protein [Pirellulales bacterium]